ncbi:GNAT family N-acetyltransferase [Clostridium thermobutyricum]|uniref:GNAT family N-acetyltransferase n=1 Tax=uncultured Clostridium sp. TaxID=59620 RepID=UPI0025843421|nr:GNAT family N-acetyltransferase [uncultured Clostridium sp.]
MLTKKEILNEVKKQLCKDYNFNIEDFENKNTLITDIKEIKGRRIYKNDKEILKILIFEGKAIISADKCIKNWCVENLSNASGEWLFLYSTLRKIDKKLNEFGYEIDNTHHYYLPCEVHEKTRPIKNIKWYEEDEILQFKGDDRFCEAFAFEESYKDVLGISALDESGNILAMAGASRDGENMWQIGINVMEEASGQGIGQNMVKLLKEEILNRGKVPFYGTVESHIISQRVALASGFYPVFAEIKIRKL